jgi:hypothetical protein
MKLKEIKAARKIIELLYYNKNEVIEFLEKEGWTTFDMTNHTWFKDKNGWLCYGPTTYGMLRDTKGIKITSIGVFIAYFKNDSSTDYGKGSIHIDQGNFNMNEKRKN